MDCENFFHFEQAVAERRNAVVAIPAAGGGERFKSRFLTRTSDGFWFDASACDPYLAARLASPGAIASFEMGSIGYCAHFAVRLSYFDPEYLVDDTPTPAIFAHAPDELHLAQRRQNYRGPVAHTAPVSLCAWKIPQHWVLRDKPKPSSQIQAALLDLSIGGMCLSLLPPKPSAPILADGDRLRIDLRFENAEAMLDAQIVYLISADMDQFPRCGVAFRKLESTIEGRRGLSLLDRAIGYLQQKSIKQSSSAA